MCWRGSQTVFKDEAEDGRASLSACRGSAGARRDAHVQQTPTDTVESQSSADCRAEAVNVKAQC